MQLLLRLANIARERDVSSTRARQLLRGIEPAAMTPDGLRLYDASVLETLTKRRRERALKMAKGTDQQRSDDPAGDHGVERPDSWAGRSGRGRLTKSPSTLEDQREPHIPHKASPAQV